MKEVRKKIAYVPQRSQIDWDFPITVRDTVLLGTFPRLGLFRRPKKADRQWAEQCLAKVDMKEFSKRQIGELSGGQQQRVFLARARSEEHTSELQSRFDLVCCLPTTVTLFPYTTLFRSDFPITVRDTVLLGTFPRLGLFRRPKKADRQWAEQCLAKVDMKEFSKRQIGELSGGQQQRVFLARA